MMNENIISFENISKNYPGVKALKEVSFKVKEGEIHGIVGENGAGKSTLLKILAGEITVYEGTLFFSGKNIKFKDPHEAINAGINVVYQDLNLCPNLNVVQNVFLGREIRENKHVNWQKMEIITNKYLNNLKLDIDPKKPTKYFNVAQQQLIEITKAVALKSKILVLDEPTSSLNQDEVHHLFILLKDLNQQGVTIIFVSHRLEEVMQIADKISVLRNGQFIKTVNKLDTNINEIVQLMIGHENIHHIDHRKIDEKETVMEIYNLGKKGYFNNINFKLFKGQILGIAGLEGSGRYALARAIFGLTGYDHGKILINLKEIKIKNPMTAIHYGIGFLSRDRKEEGIFPKMDLVENIMMVKTLKDRKINRKINEKITGSFIEKLSIAHSHLRQVISGLSGGNQQKCLVSRWLAEDPQIIIMEEPTRGIDIGAKAEMFKIIRNLADSGKSIIMISTEMDELLDECDKIIVMQRGELSGEVMAEKTNKEEIMKMATGIAV